METSAILRQVPIRVFGFCITIKKKCLTHIHIHIAANIDGETNLKVREAPASLLDHLGQVISEG